MKVNLVGAWPTRELGAWRVGLAEDRLPRLAAHALPDPAAGAKG